MASLAPPQPGARGGSPPLPPPSYAPNALIFVSRLYSTISNDPTWKIIRVSRGSTVSDQGADGSKESPSDPGVHLQQIQNKFQGILWFRAETLQWCGFFGVLDLHRRVLVGQMLWSVVANFEGRQKEPMEREKEEGIISGMRGLLISMDNKTPAYLTWFNLRATDRITSLYLTRLSSGNLVNGKLDGLCPFHSIYTWRKRMRCDRRWKMEVEVKWVTKHSPVCAVYCTMWQPRLFVGIQLARISGTMYLTQVT